MKLLSKQELRLLCMSDAAVQRFATKQARHSRIVATVAYKGETRKVRMDRVRHPSGGNGRAWNSFLANNPA